MEPVGLGLSALTLFIECLKAYRVFSTAKHVDAELNLVKTKFQIEETRFIQWGTYWGYRTEPSECALDRNIGHAGQNVTSTVKLTLSQIINLLKEYNSVFTKYNTTDRNTAYRGMTWAVKDKARLESIVHNLNQFNDGLHQLLPRKDEASLAQATACAVLNNNTDAQLTAVITVMEGMHNLDAAKLARFKRAYQMVISEDERQPSYAYQLSLSLELDFARVQLSGRHSSKERTLGILDGCPNSRIIVEWRPYDPGTFAGSAADRIVLKQRAARLAELLSSRNPRPMNFNVLTCAGYFDQATLQRYGFVYEIPSSVIQHMPFTLHELLAPRFMPDLGTRFRLAQSLARTIYLLHSSGWLHKSIRPTNIILFQHPGTNAPIFETPYLGGFIFSRPDDRDEPTFHERSAGPSENQLYRSPEVQSPSNARRFLASDDVYSFGLVLLEIAFWKPLVAIEGRNDVNSRELLDMQKIAAAVSSLPRSMGRIYSEVVENCLRPTKTTSPLPPIEMSAEWMADRIQEQNKFYWDVVKRLEECRA
ncbi:hypothetical protein N7530_006022 [Penicillium desertorum]|uniref:Protein kinase domain-containing protein n=1 Tax=Penicillium desertorum TaxID=1303715 RepID=A0A9W9X144_9EURO|nr:hypothetical protein N7530_006022 [Penicillium desertorum]